MASLRSFFRRLFGRRQDDENGVPKGQLGPWPQGCPKCSSSTIDERRPLRAVGVIVVECKCPACGHQWTYQAFA